MYYINCGIFFTIRRKGGKFQYDFETAFVHFVETLVTVHDDHIRRRRRCQPTIVQRVDVVQVVDRDVTLFASTAPFQPIETDGRVRFQIYRVVGNDREISREELSPIVSKRSGWFARKA